MPRPKKPRQLKILAGTIRPCRDSHPGVTLPRLEELPDPPAWLPTPEAVNEWNRLGAILLANGLLTAVSLGPLGHLCAVHGKMVKLWAAGECPPGNLLAQYRYLTGDFGLTPAAASKVSKRPGPRENPFAKFRKK